MRKTPLVAIVGRPNVGKSSLFNLLAGHRISIVDDEAGVTRDRIYAPVEWAGHTFTLVDTGGVDFDESNAFAAHIREQVDIAIDLADVIMFVTNGESGIHPADMDIANLLRKSKKPIILAVNKLDNDKREQNELYDFYKLKLGEPIGISCAQKRGIGELLDAVLERCPRSKGLDDDEKGIVRIAIVGKPNAGKSSIVNRLLGEKRVMVSDIAGTTRDSIDTPFRYDGREYILTDTAGIRRKRSVEEQTIEHYAIMRALASIRNSDVSVLVVDAVEGLTEQDVRLAGYIHEEGKPSVIVINKWDIVTNNERLITANEGKDRVFLEYNKNLERDLAFMSYFKAIFISALTGQRTGEIMKAVDQVLANSKTRITTGKLNQLIMDYVTVNPTRAKIKYATQVAITPPAFAIFVSKKELLPDTYMRYLENNLRKSVDFTGTPIRLLLRDSSPSTEGPRRKK